MALKFTGGITGSGPIKVIVPTATFDGIVGGPPDPDFANVSLLMHMDADPFTDVTGKTITEFGTVTLDNTLPKFGVGCAVYGGSDTDRLSANDGGSGDFNMGTGDFTFECFARTGGGGFITLFAVGNLNFRWAWIGSGGSNFFQFWNNSVNVLNNVVTNINDNVYRHFALVRDSGTVYLYEDGTAIDSAGYGGAVNPGANLNIGNQADFPESWECRIDEVRVTKGVARYPGGTSFTVPTEAFPDS